MFFLIGGDQRRKEEKKHQGTCQGEVWLSCRHLEYCSPDPESGRVMVMAVQQFQ
jgi:hypothetical protein